MSTTDLSLVRGLATTIMIIVIVGCSGDTATTSPDSNATDTTTVPPADAPVVPDLTSALGGGNKTAASATGHAAGQATTETPIEEERQVAVAGVGKKGSRYGGGIISEPVSQYFGARERITFISIQKAMRTFEALHERNPESHEEFMKEIVEENGLKLPSLFEGERYEYDPERGELMVVRPKKD